ncbi:MAG: hypothetical protein MK041_03125 [Aquabacterium sp.]|nr:hypothetical protein [Aquabacterium sp.]
MSHDDIPLAANGPAYTSRQERHGVPLSYVGDKLGHAIEELHRHGSRHPAQRQDLFASMHYLLVAYLGLHNMLAKANDRSLVGRLLEASDAELKAWLALVAREGDVAGLADLDRP